MAQARVKATGEIVELMPGSKDGRFCMRDVKTGKFYTWDLLERVAVKAGVAPATTSAVKVQIGASVSGSMETKQN